MIITWVIPHILIVMLSGSFSAEFDSKEACEVARDKVIQNAIKFECLKRIAEEKVFCVPKE